VPFSRQGPGREAAYAAPLSISKGSSYAGTHAPLPDTGEIAGRVRSYSAQAEWLGDCAIGPNAQLFPIIIQCGHP